MTNPDALDYPAALRYLYHFADFERTGTFARDPEGNLRRMRDLLADLGQPDRAYPTTHVAGTKGKGSTAALIAAALTASGIHTGLYTQPDLHTFRERIQLDSQPIDAATVAELVGELAQALDRRPDADRTQTITYEVATALAFLAFARAGVAHGVIEVGLGGRLDATNVIQPLVGVITSISLDHTAILGPTVEAIAREKAGIIKPRMAVITSAQAPAALAVIAEVCAAQGVALTKVGPTGSGANYTYDREPPHRITSPDDLMPPPFIIHGPSGDRTVSISLLGMHQRENATAALAALEALRARGVPVTDEGIATGFRTTHWPGRLDVVGTQPWVVIDGAHNADSLARLLEAVQQLFTFQRLVVVLGTMRDKDIAGMRAVLEGIPDQLRWLVTTSAGTSRARSAADLAQDMADVAPTVEAVEDIGAALETALAMASPNDLVLITGSLYLAGAALRWCQAHLDNPLARQIPIAGDDHAGD